MVLTTKTNFENKLEQSLNFISAIEQFPIKNKTDFKNISEARNALKETVRNSKEYQTGIVMYPKIRTSFWGKQNLNNFSKSLDNFHKIKYEGIKHY